jgi:hypothetical protein
MKKSVAVVKGIVVLALVAFVVLVIIGLYTALDSATKPYAAASAVPQTDTAVESVPVDGRDTDEQDGGDATSSTAADGKASTSLPSVQDNSDNTATITPSSSQVPQTQQSQTPAVPTYTAPATSATKPPSSGGSSGFDNSGSAAQQKVWHEPVYETVHHEAVYSTVHHEAEYSTVTDYYTVCHQCSFKIQGSIYPHLDATGHTGYSSDVPFERSVLVRDAHDERVLVSAAYDEQVLVRAGYWE